MSSGEEGGRHGLGDPPEGIGEVVRALLGKGRMHRGISLGRLALAWDRVVGPELARETAPLSLDGGGLLVAASSPGWGTRVRFQDEDIRRRANEALGGEEVASVTVIVSADARKGRQNPLRDNAFGAGEPPGGTPGGGSPE
ncbi:MAG: DUF721 domain-containing protein [Actinomycetota bacterium]